MTVSMNEDMSVIPQQFPPRPLEGLLGELRPHAEHRAEPAGKLAATHTLVLLWLTLLLALLERRHPGIFPRHRGPAARSWHARSWGHAPDPGPDSASADPRRIARILYVLGPRPNTAMRPHAVPPPAPRPTPPIRPPPVRPPAKTVSEAKRHRTTKILRYHNKNKPPTAPATAAAAGSPRAPKAAHTSPPATAPSAPPRTPPPARTGSPPPGSPPQSMPSASAH